MKGFGKAGSVAGFMMTVAVTSFLGACQQSGQSPTNPEAASSSAGTTPSSTSGPVRLATYAPGPYIPLSTCNLGMVNSTVFEAQPVALKAGQSNHFKGWLIAAGLSNPAYWLRFDEQQANRFQQTPISLTVERPDVVAAHAGAPIVSGFDLELPPNALTPGQYHVYVAVESSGRTYICDSGRHVQVGP